MGTDVGKISKIKKTAAEHAELIRFFALLISGVAIGLIFNAVCGYEYSFSLTEHVRFCFTPPFDGVSGFFGIFGTVIYAAGTDIVLVLLVFLFGLTYICRQSCSLLIILRGVFLGLSTGILAVSASGGTLECPHPVICSFVYILHSAVISLLLVFLSHFAERASTLFRGLSERTSNMIFTARFGAYFIAAAASSGAVIILRSLYLILIHMLTA